MQMELHENNHWLDNQKELHQECHKLKQENHRLVFKLYSANEGRDLSKAALPKGVKDKATQMGKP